MKKVKNVSSRKTENSRKNFTILLSPVHNIDVCTLKHAVLKN